MILAFVDRADRRASFGVAPCRSADLKVREVPEWPARAGTSALSRCRTSGYARSTACLPVHLERRIALFAPLAAYQSCA